MVGIGIGLNLRMDAVGGGAAPVSEGNLGPSGATTDGSVTAIQADGWRATYTSPPAEFDPVSDPKYVVVTRDGFDATGSATTYTDAIELMKRVRLPDPDEGTLTANDVALADFIYSGDTVTGVTNNSTQSYPKPQAMWLDHDLQRVTDQTYTARLYVAHAHARWGRPVAAVTISATDGTTTVSETVSAMTAVAYTASGLTAPVYEATLDFSTLDDDALITIDAEIFPWVGDASFTASTDFGTYPGAQFSEMKVFNAVSETPIYAYVDPAGDNGTGTASTTEGTASAAPFATILAAAQAIVTLDGADASRGIVKVNNGTYAHSDFSAVAVGDTPIIIEGESKAGVVIQSPTSGLPDDIPDKVKFKNVTMRQMANNQYWLNSYATAAADKWTIFENVDWDINGFTVNGYVCAEAGFVWMINNTGDDVGQTRAFSSWTSVVRAIGCNVPGFDSSLYHAVGCLSTDAEVQENAASGYIVDGRVLGHCKFTQSSDTVVLSINKDIGADGFAITGSVFTKSTGTQPVINFNDIGNANPTQNVVMHGSTVDGERVNWLYNDTGTAAVAKSSSIRNCLFESWNVKGDVFGSNSNLVGNWPVRYKVSARDNTYEVGSDGGDTPSASAWIGEVAAIGEVIGTDASPETAGTVAENRACYSHDQDGNALADDGTDLHGAIVA